MVIQFISSVSVYLLWFEYQFIDGKLFEHTLFASMSFLLGCLLGGILLSKMSASRIKSSKGKVRNLRCVLVSMFTLSLLGSLLLIVVEKKGVNLTQGYVEIIIFIVQLGISSSFVTNNVAVLILISPLHRLKIFALLQTLNVLAIVFQPSLSSYMRTIGGISVYSLIVASSIGIILSLLISYRGSIKANRTIEEAAVLDQSEEEVEELVQSAA